MSCQFIIPIIITIAGPLPFQVIGLSNHARIILNKRLGLHSGRPIKHRLLIPCDLLAPCHVYKQGRLTIQKKIICQKVRRKSYIRIFKNTLFIASF